MTIEELLLITLAEELAETTQRVSKALRFTLSEVQEGQELSNAQRIVYEFNDVLAIMEIMHERGMLPPIRVQEYIDLKRAKLEKWANYSAEVGTLSLKEK